MITVETGDPRDPQATALLRQSHALMESLFPPEDNYFLDIDALCVPSITFFVAKDAGNIVGTAALATKGDYGEVKSMFVDPNIRGKGIAAALLQKLEETARAAGLTALKLETGNVLHAAHRLYQRHGFTDCGPFGEYSANQTSVFMEKAL